MMTTSVGCGDGCELPYDRINESGDFRSCHDVPAMSALWSLSEDKRTSKGFADGAKESLRVIALAVASWRAKRCDHESL